MKILIKLSLLLFVGSLLAEGSTVTTSEWSSDADVSVDSDGIYAHLINLDSGSDQVAVNNQIFVPSVGETNTYTVYRGSWWEFSGMGGSVSGAVILEMGMVSGAAANLIGRLYYDNRPAESRTSVSIKLCGLAPGAHYRMSLISVGWDAAVDTRTQAVFVNGDPLESVNGDAADFTISPNEFGKGHGFVLSLDYTASENGDVELVLTPANDAVAPMVIGAVVNQLLDPFEPHQYEMGYEEPAGIRIIPYNMDWVPRFSSQGSRNLWALSRSRMDFYLITRGIVRDIQQSAAADQAEIFEFLSERVICFDDMSVTENGLDGDRTDKDGVFMQIADGIEYLYTNGVSVSCLLMQSTMSKGTQDYSVEERVADSVYYAEFMDAELATREIPLPSYGLIDASRAKMYSNWQTLLGAWVDGMNAIGKPPVMIIHDYPSYIMLGSGSAGELLDAMEYSHDTLGLNSYWWISAGRNLTPLQGRNYMINSMSIYFALTGADMATTGLLFGDFHYVYSSDAPDRMDGPAYAGLEVFNEIYNKALLYQTASAIPDSSEYNGWATRALGSWSTASGVSDDPDGDDLKNSIEYFFGMNPLVANSDSGRLPEITGYDASSESLILNYTRSGDVDDAALRLLAAETLAGSGWEIRTLDTDWSIRSQVQNADGTVTVSIAVSVSGDQKFFKTGVDVSSE